MIQILGLRPYVHSKTGKTLQRVVFFGRKYRAASVQDILNRPDELLKDVPINEQWNLYFTVADCHEEKERELKEQWVLPFDIDGIHIKGEDAESLKASAMPVFQAACEALGVQPFETGGLFSGHGVQLFVPLSKPILSADYFDQYRAHYKILADAIAIKLKEKGLQGTVDTSVFSAARLMRMPRTMNKKEGKENRLSFVLNADMVAHGFDLVSKAGIPVESEGDKPSMLKRYPKPDTKAVCEGCKFLQHCKDKPNEIHEPQWYAMLSIVARLDDGEALAHAYSEGHSGYVHYETDIKIKQALQSAGPRTCDNISTLWDGCKTCDNYGKVISPITIKGPDYIKSKDHGFREVRLSKEGIPMPGKPAYDDLLKQFEVEYLYKSVKDSNMLFVYNGTHWIEMSEKETKAWVVDKVYPSPTVAEMNEFYGRLVTQNLCAYDWFYSSNEGYANFTNGVVHLASKQLLPSSPDYGFTSTLPYAYDATATAPKFTAFIGEIIPSADIRKVLLEYLGYCISGDSCWLQKAMLLVGYGANGKSVLLETMAKVAGEGNYSARPLQDLKTPIDRQHLVHKLFNYSEETAYGALVESSVFKNLVTGGRMQVKQLYKQPIEIDNRAKMIFSANEMPKINDKSDGVFRRFVIIKLTKQFLKDKANPFIKDELAQELPGIFNIVIDAYLECKKRKVMYYSKELDDIVDAVRYDADPVAQYITEACEVLPVTDSTVVTKEGLYQSYSSWAVNNGYRALNNVHFFRHLANIVPDLEQRHTRVQSMDNKRVIKGIKIYDTY